MDINNAISSIASQLTSAQARVNAVEMGQQIEDSKVQSLQDQIDDLKNMIRDLREFVIEEVGRAQDVAKAALESSNVGLEATSKEPNITLSLKKASPSLNRKQVNDIFDTISHNPQHLVVSIENALNKPASVKQVLSYAEETTKDEGDLVFERKVVVDAEERDIVFKFNVNSRLWEIVKTEEHYNKNKVKKGTKNANSKRK